MKKIVYVISCTILSLSGMAQNRGFLPEIMPSANNETIKLGDKIFKGDYSSTTDFVDVLAISADCTVFDQSKGQFAPMKGSISGVYVIRDGTLGAAQDLKATVFATIDKKQADPVLGNGGGVIFFKIERSTPESAWKVVANGVSPEPEERDIYFKNVDFSKVGMTISNKGFAYVGRVNNKTQRFFVTEDVSDIHSNQDLVGLADTADYTYPNQFTKASNIRSIIPRGKKIKKYQSLGWLVEIDGITGEVISKVHRLGRGITAITNDGSGFVFAYGGNPSVLMRYSPYGDLNSIDKQDVPAGDPKTGDGAILLNAYKQNADGTGGFTIPIALQVDSVLGDDPDNPERMVASYSQIFDSLLVAKEVALRAGATMFANIGDITYTTDEYGYKVYLITEQGVKEGEDGYHNAAKKYNGVLAQHLQGLDKLDGTEDGNFRDPFGRILVLNNLDVNGKIGVFLEGGVARAGNFFANPNKLEIETLNPGNLGDGQLVTLLTVKEEALDFTPATVNEAYYFQFQSSLQGVLPLDATAENLVKPISINESHLYQVGSNGSRLTSNGGHQSDNTGTFITNGTIENTTESKFDTYLTVVNGYKGTDKSMILAIRNISPAADPVGLPFEDAALETSFGAWPNPTHGLLHVAEADNYVVCDMAGQMLKTFAATKTLDLSDLNKGVYLVKKANGAVRKIIVE